MLQVAGYLIRRRYVTHPKKNKKTHLHTGGGEIVEVYAHQLPRVRRLQPPRRLRACRAVSQKRGRICGPVRGEVRVHPPDGALG